MSTQKPVHWCLQQLYSQLPATGSNQNVLQKGEWIKKLWAIHIKHTALCLVTQSCPTLCDPMDCSPPGSSVHGDSPGKNTGVGCHALLQGFFPTQELNPDLPYCRRILNHPSQQNIIQQQKEMSHRELLKSILLSERSQSEKDILCIILTIWHFGKEKLHTVKKKKKSGSNQGWITRTQRIFRAVKLFCMILLW